MLSEMGPLLLPIDEKIRPTEASKDCPVGGGARVYVQVCGPQSPYF